MARKLVFPNLKTIAIGTGLSVGLLVVANWLIRSKSSASDAHRFGNALPDHSNPEQPTGEMQHDDADPLAAADVYVAFGRRKSAHEVLESAVETGRLRAEDVTLFWAKHDLKKSSAAMAKAVSEPPHL